MKPIICRLLMWLANKVLWRIADKISRVANRTWDLSQAVNNFSWRVYDWGKKSLYGGHVQIR